MKKHMFLVVSIILSMVLTACGGSVSNKALQKLLASDDDFSYLEASSAKAVKETEIADKTKALLFTAKESDGKSAYRMAVLSTGRDDLAPLSINYLPLSLFAEEISADRPQSINEALFDKIVSVISKDIKSFETEEICVGFLKDITLDGVIMPADTARQIMTDAMRAEYAKEEAEDFYVVFEKDCASPVYYAENALESMYNWTWLPESQYLSFVSSSDKADLEEAEAKYGPAYTEQSVWIAYDLKGVKVGIYKTKSELSEKLTGDPGDFGEEEKETEGILKLATVSDKPPFTYESDGLPAGVEVEIAKAIAKELNMELEISAMNSEAAVKATANGTYAMAMAGYTAAVKGDNISFTDNYYNDYVIVLGKGGGKINDRICAALATLKSNGTIGNIVSNYDFSQLKNEVLPKQEKPADESDEPVAEAEAAETPKISYRVRKSADDSKSQIGAFASLENAKKEATAHKDEGYKVYDMSGKLIYTP